MIRKHKGKWCGVEGEVVLLRDDRHDRIEILTAQNVGPVTEGRRELATFAFSGASFDRWVDQVILPIRNRASEP